MPAMQRSLLDRPGLETIGDNVRGSPHKGHTKNAARAFGAAAVIASDGLAGYLQVVSRGLSLARCLAAG